MCILSFYLTDKLALDLVAPIPGALCATFFLVNANSPRQCPIIPSSIITGTNSLPWCTFIVLPIISGNIIMSLHCVSMFFSFALNFLSRIFCCSVNPFFIVLLCLDVISCATSFRLIALSSSTVFPLKVNSFFAISTSSFFLFFLGLSCLLFFLAVSSLLTVLEFLLHASLILQTDGLLNSLMSH